MTIRISPLGLPIDYIGDAEARPVGASAPAQAGSVTALADDPIRQIGPHGLVTSYPPSVFGSTVSITGASAPALSGNVTAQPFNPDVFAQLGPHILVGPIRSIGPIVGSIDVFIVGAEAEAQGEEMEGADATIYIDGAAGVSETGAVVATEAPEAEGAVVIFVNGRGPRIAVGET